MCFTKCKYLWKQRCKKKSGSLSNPLYKKGKMSLSCVSRGGQFRAAGIEFLTPNTHNFIILFYCQSLSLLQGPGGRPVRFSTVPFEQTVWQLEARLLQITFYWYGLPVEVSLDVHTMTVVPLGSRDTWIVGFYYTRLVNGDKVKTPNILNFSNKDTLFFFLFLMHTSGWVY